MHRRLAGLLLIALLGCRATADEPRSDAPSPFRQLGVIEGFYGPPWSHQDRLDLLDFMGRAGLYDYYYAPKDDPFHLARWRDPYPPDLAAELRELADTARANGVRLHWAISPGGSMVYADSSDYRQLLAKIGSVAALGIEHFGLFLDDVPPTLADERDRQRFGTLGTAHAWLTTRLAADMRDRGWPLAVTPTTYTNVFGDREYLRELAAGTPEDVPILWTGTDVVPPEITVADAGRWSELIRRPPLVWDNYPVNDFARWRPFLGPVVGREPDLASATWGIVANPMNEAHASMIPLATLASYGRDPLHYDPAVALQLGVTQHFGADALGALAPFLELFGDYPWDANLFEPLFILGDPIDVPAVGGAIARLRVALDSLERLGHDRPELLVLADELTPFVDGIANRLAELRRDTAYRAVGDRLAFRSALDQIVVPRPSSAVTVDGSLSDWRAAAWRSLGTVDDPGPAVAFVADDHTLYVAIRVPAVKIQPAADDRIGEGDHVALILQADTDRHRQYVTGDDRWILIPAPGEHDDVGRPRVVSLPVEGFIAKYLADNARLTLSEFFLASIGQSVSPAESGVRGATWRTPTGWAVELQVPRPAPGSLRLSLTVAARPAERRVVYGLATRHYPGNPATYVELEFER
ncbi:MAG: beta-N-acetylglucosaminidase domain-containing protein [Gemmatimonadales bacterium]|jgi:hypothetical protein